jgi:NitT/TauT family transport system ATP-binding protein
MRQRVGIARALVANPEVLLMDEPLGALDAQTKLVLQEELLRIWSARRKAVVYVTHDIEEAILLGDRVIVLTGRPGRILDEIPVPLGRPRDLLDPGHAGVQAIRRHVWGLLEADVRRSLGL